MNSVTKTRMRRFIRNGYLLPVIFALVIAAIYFFGTDVTVADIFRSLSEFPVSTLLIAGICCLVLTGIFRAAPDRVKERFGRMMQIANFIGHMAFILAALLMAYSADYYRADSTAQEALKSTQTVQVTVSEDEVLFCPADGSEIGLVFYPGGKVEHTAYAPLLHELAEEGITCILVRMPLQLAIFNINAADKVINNHPEIRHWYISGHSVGGVSASVYARNNEEKIEGLILLASYSSMPLKGFKALTIYGSEDGVLNRGTYEKSRVNLPLNSLEVEIPGGNHAQFGSYGIQDGDGLPKISAKKQREITCDAIVEFIRPDAMTK